MVKKRGFKLKMFIDFDKSSTKIFVNYFIEDFKTEIKIPLKNDNVDTNGIIVLDKLDFSNKIFLASIF